MPTWTSTDNLGWGGFERMWRRKKLRERVSERERDEIWIEATFQGTISFPSPCLCFRALLDPKAISGFLHENFTLSWHVSRNTSVANSTPCLAPWLLKWHTVWVKLNDTLYFPWSEKSLPIEMSAHRLFFLSCSLMSLSRGLLFGCLERHLFTPKEILSCVFMWGSDWESTWAWSATHAIRDPSW